MPGRLIIFIPTRELDPDKVWLPAWSGEEVCSDNVHVVWGSQVVISLLAVTPQQWSVIDLEFSHWVIWK